MESTFQEHPLASHALGKSNQTQLIFTQELCRAAWSPLAMFRKLFGLHLGILELNLESHQLHCNS